MHVDTDGIIVRKRNEIPSPAGSAVGDWRVKTIMRKVEIRAPQLYRWECKECGAAHPEYHYVASGSTPEQARYLFSTVPESRVQINWRPSIDTVLPPAHSSDVLRRPA